MKVIFEVLPATDSAGKLNINLLAKSDILPPETLKEAVEACDIEETAMRILADIIARIGGPIVGGAAALHSLMEHRPEDLDDQETRKVYEVLLATILERGMVRPHDDPMALIKFAVAVADVGQMIDTFIGQVIHREKRATAKESV